jgi:hypothetical protein
MIMSSALRVYLVAWSLATGIALAVAYAQRRRLSLFSGAYRALITVRWKVITFAVAMAAMMLVAPFTGDPTWDAWDAGLMAVLTYLTAPWSVGVLVLAARRRVPGSQAYVAAVLWMVSTSWSYDLYILLRDGAYPAAWQSNIALSSVLYACAGMLWNLEWRPGLGVTFAFLQPGWPAPPADRRFGRLAWTAAPLMALAAALILVFVYDFLRA